MKKCLIVSFDFSKTQDGYPSIPYSIASILAKFKDSAFIAIETYSYDMHIDPPALADIESRIVEDFKNRFLNKIDKYAFLALSAYAWSETLVNQLIKTIKPIFGGKIILGGYEITALSEEKLSVLYPGADFYIKGYAEKSLELIFRNKTDKNILSEPVDSSDLVSPYISKTLELNTQKIYWESKRGCPYHCDFCEWGNAGNGKIIRFEKSRIEQEIELFKANNVRSINVLDGTFLLEQSDVETLEKLLEIPDCTITLQVHFSPIKGNLKDAFLALCQKHRDRIFLEFGLQTIHQKEMDVLRRNNAIDHIKAIMGELNRRKINYETSIIFGIPGQTVESFGNTIAFIEENGGGKFRAFPLRLPQNSEMKEKMTALKIKETKSPHDFPLMTFVTESYSFTYADWEVMYSLANHYSRDKKPLFQNASAKSITPIIDRVWYEYSSGGVHADVAFASVSRSIFNKETREKIAAFIFELLRNSEGVTQSLSSSDTDNFAQAIENILGNETLRELCAEDESLAKQVTQDTLDFIKKTKLHILKQENPFEAEQQCFDAFEQTAAEGFEEAWKTAVSALQEVYTQDALDTDFYYKEFQKSLEPPKEQKERKTISFQSVKEHFLEKWGGLLFQKKLKRELDLIEAQRKRFCEELYKQIEDLKKLQEILEPFTGELGRLWDMSRGRWQKVNFDILKKYAELLQRDSLLRELAETLGRMHQAEREYEEELFAAMILKPDWKIDHAGKADLVGVHESDDISSMLPAEAALLSDETTDLLFYKKFTEKKLQTFEYQAKTRSHREEEIQKTRQKAKETPKGPFIICVDTSGSMHGTPETIAKTLCFALLKTAVRDSRKCFLISFSTGIETLELTDMKNDLDKLIVFLSMSFHGGTDAMPAMREALRMLKTEDYKKADVIMVSDFVMPGFDEETKTNIKTAKESKTKFHSLVIGDSGNKNTLEDFDSNWAYNVHNPNSIVTLVKNLNELDKKKL